MADLSVNIKGLDALKRKLGSLWTRSFRTRLNRHVGVFVREQVASHIAVASKDRHKCADRLGARHSRVLEFAPARGSVRGGSAARPRPGEGTPYTEVADVTPEGARVVIGNTPGLRRAFGPLTITPKRAKYLTIPVDKEAYGVRAREFPRALVFITSRRGHRLLAEETRDATHRLRPKYLLVRSAVVRHDPGLLPRPSEIHSWAHDAVSGFLAAEIRRGG